MSKLILLIILIIHPTILYAQNPRPSLRATFGQSVPSNTAPMMDGSGRIKIINDYCIRCHNDQLVTGGLSLNRLASEDISQNGKVWERVLDKIRSGQMPPPGMPRPDETSSSTLITWLERRLDQAAQANPNPGRVGVHRLNRTEYGNAIRDLLALEINSKELLLPDESDQGFDNVASSLTISPAHFERYLSAARKISRLAVGDPSMGIIPNFKVYSVPRLLNQDDRINENMPFGSRGGIDIRHHFPLDGEYLIKIRLQRQIYDYIIGLGDRQLLDVRLDGKRLMRFQIGGIGNEKGTPAPLTWAGEINGDDEWEEYMHSADDDLQVRVPIQAGTRTISVSFLKAPRELELPPQPKPRGFSMMSDQQYNGYAAVDSLSIGGPYLAQRTKESPSRSKIFVCQPESIGEEKSCATSILSKLGRRAYRRPLKATELKTLIDFYEIGRIQNDFEFGIQSAIERLLVSPHFLLRIEHPPPNMGPNKTYRLSALDLASRLSFFLWSSIPDEQLLDVAVQNQLHDEDVFGKEVRRMLADPRSLALLHNFTTQWLTTRKALTWQPDPDQFPDFNENLRHALLEETKLFLNEQFRENRSIIDLLSANYTFVNQQLAEHYGIEDIYGERFRRVELTDKSRGGLLGHGSILMVTSYPNRTAPVVRGLWLLENILGMPPPPPPASVPDLESTNEQGKLLTIRQQMEQHRKNPSCATCHRLMDPLGFALENFDAIGRWRSETNGMVIDASSVAGDGTLIEGVPGIRNFLLNHKEDFVRTFTEKLLIYSLGRELEYYDNPTIRKILRDAAKNEFRWSSIIMGIVTSLPFQTTRSSP